ncbi:MAG TPA: porin family protein [Rhodospirillales bacterium]|nr:porin family protein [Rhodospirillales bacterium]
MLVVGYNHQGDAKGALRKRFPVILAVFFLSSLTNMAFAQAPLSGAGLSAPDHAINNYLSQNTPPGSQKTVAQYDLSVGSLGRLSLDGVLVNLPNSGLTESELTSLGFGREFVFDTGLVLDGGLKYGLGDGLGAEVELAYRQKDAGKFSLGGYDLGASADIGGGTTAVTFSANGYYDLPSGGRLMPFIGAGVGFANTNLDKNGRTTEDSDRVFAYKFATGLNFIFNQNLSLKGEYKYFTNADPKYSATGGEYDGHSVGMNLSFDF